MRRVRSRNGRRVNHTYNAISNSARSISPEPSLSICLKYFATWGEGWWYGRTKVVNGGLDEWGAALAHAHLAGGKKMPSAGNMVQNSS